MNIILGFVRNVDVTNVPQKRLRYIDILSSSLYILNGM